MNKFRCFIILHKTYLGNNKMFHIVMHYVKKIRIIVYKDAYLFFIFKKYESDTQSFLYLHGRYIPQVIKQIEIT